MTQTKPDDETLVGLPPNRIEALADGIFAVAMTILVLELHVPSAPAAGSEDLFAELWTLWPKIVSYASGFVILGTLWVGHHYQFHYIKRSDRTLLWLNLLFLLAITFLPFVIALLGAHGATRVGCVLYGGTLMVAGSCLLAQWLYATRDRRLTGGEVAPEVVRALRARILFGLVGYGAGFGLAWIEPRASVVCYGAMPLLYLLPSRIDKHVKR